MTPIKRRIVYYFSGNRPLNLRVKWNSQECYINVGYYVDKNKWDGCRCKNNTYHGTERISGSIINKAIEDILNNINQTFFQFEMEDKVPSKDDFRNKFYQTEDKPGIDADAAWLEFQREGLKLKQWSANTLKSVRQVQNLFRLVFPKITVDQINKETLDKFIEYQQTNKLVNHKDYKPSKSSQFNQGYANNVISKNCSILKRFLKWGVEKNYISSDIVNKWHPSIKAIRKPVIFLNWEELTALANLDLSDNIRFQQIRDIFCFMCFTSLRYSDAIALKPSQVHNEYITITTQKTSDNLTIELNKHSQAILERYLGQCGDTVFPHHNNRDMNMYLKVIAKLAGIDSDITISQYYGNERINRTAPKYKFISTHCGRRTFVCNALSMGIPPHIVMKWTGHKELTALKPYMDVADGIKKSEMAKFDKML